MLPPGTNYCLCRSCGEYFGGVSSFDHHRKGAECRDPESLMGKYGQTLLSKNARGYWVQAFGSAQTAEIAA